jgi:hypothetical protein
MKLARNMAIFGCMILLLGEIVVLCPVADLRCHGLRQRKADR